MRQTTPAGTVTQLLYDGQDLVAEYDAAGKLLRRYMRGPGTDEPLVAYDGPGTANKTWLYADHLGSVVAQKGAVGSPSTLYRYGPYGESDAAAGMRFGFTGQQHIAELELYH